MTTKEFIRRSEYFNSIDAACISLSGRLFCWQIISTYGNTISTYYTHDIDSFLSEHPAFLTYLDSLWIERYSKQKFKIEYDYFKAFLARLSNYQLESLKASGKCSHLLAYFYLNDNKE